jgi:hypothetical protein
VKLSPGAEQLLAGGALGAAEPGAKVFSSAELISHDAPAAAAAHGNGNGAAALARGAGMGPQEKARRVAAAVADAKATLRRLQVRVWGVGSGLVRLGLMPPAYLAARVGRPRACGFLKPREGLPDITPCTRPQPGTTPPACFPRCLPAATPAASGRACPHIGQRSPCPARPTESYAGGPSATAAPPCPPSPKPTQLKPTNRANANDPLTPPRLPP